MLPLMVIKWRDSLNLVPKFRTVSECSLYLMISTEYTKACLLTDFGMGTADLFTKTGIIILVSSVMAITTAMANSI